METTDNKQARKQAPSVKWKDLHPNIKLRIGESFLSTLVGSMVFPFMAIYLSMHFGERMAGILLLFNVVGIFIGGGLGGFAADRLGRRSTMITAEGARLISIIVMGAANSQWWISPETTYATMLVINASAALSMPAIQSMIVDSSNGGNRTVVYSTIYWINNAALLIGSLGGGVLFREHLFILCIGMSAASLISLAVLVFFIKESRPQAADGASSAGTGEGSPTVVKPSTGFLAKYRVVFGDWIFLAFVFASALALSLEYLSKNYTSVRLDREFGTERYELFGSIFMFDGIRTYGLLIAVNALVIIVASRFIVYLAKRITGEWLMAVGILLCALGYGVLGVSNDLWLLIPFMCLAGCGQVMFATMKQTYLASIIPAHNRGPYMAISGMEFLVANVVGSTGLILGTWLPSWMMGGLFFGMGAVGLLLLIFLFVRKSAAGKKAAVVQQANQTG